MITTDDTILGETGLSIKEIFDISAKRLHAVYLMDIEHNNIIPIKSSKDAQMYNGDILLNWDDSLDDIINSFLKPEFRGAAKVLYNREYIKKSLGKMEQHAEFVFQRISGEWNNLTVIPVKTKDGECLSALVTIVDITAVKMRAEAMEKQMSDVKKDIHYLNKIFSVVASDSFSQVIKFDTLTGDSSKITFEDGEIKETPLSSWTLYYEKIFENVHLEDVKEIQSCFDKDKLREMEPGTKIQKIYRMKNFSSNAKSEEYHWYKTTILIPEEELTIAIAITSDITEDLLIIKDRIK